MKLSDEAQTMSDILKEEFNADVIKNEREASEIAQAFIGLGELLLEVKERNRKRQEEQQGAESARD